MRRSSAALTLALALACATPPETSPRLPLEVIGPAGTHASLSIDVPEGPWDELELTVHNVVGSDSAFVTIAGERFDLAAHGAHRPFGGVGVARVPLPASARGTVELSFSYDREVRAVSGFRVLALSLVGVDQRHEVVLAHDDPSTWRVETDAAAIQRGRRYFTEETRDDGPTCGTCHADDGADLAYFAFTSHAIAVRAEHHLFSPDEAEDIARYVRALPVAPVGRVFDPPFQPGVGNTGGRGAGYGAVVADLSPALSRLGEGELAWDVASTLDTFVLPSEVQVPSWFRWLPRTFDPAWRTREGGVLAATEQALRERGSLEDAVAFQAAAITVARDVLVLDGDHQGRVELLRYAAVKLWDWQRRRGGFDDEAHGFPDGGPAFPYEVGFAFFEAAEGDALPDAWEQTASWWAAQLAVDPGRGLSTGERPLNYRDVLLAFENAGATPSTLVLVHLLGSFEEDRSLPERFGTADGPVRLLAVPLRHADGPLAERLLRRFLVRSAAFAAGGGEFEPSFLTLLGDAWASSCTSFTDETRSSLRSACPVLTPALNACP